MAQQAASKRGGGLSAKAVIIIRYNDPYTADLGGIIFNTRLEAFDILKEKKEDDFFENQMTSSASSVLTHAYNNQNNKIPYEKYMFEKGRGLADEASKTKIFIDVVIEDSDDVTKYPMTHLAFFAENPREFKTAEDIPEDLVTFWTKIINQNLNGHTRKKLEPEGFGRIICLPKLNDPNRASIVTNAPKAIRLVFNANTKHKIPKYVANIIKELKTL